MKINIAWDLDGVLRDLTGYLGVTSTEYNNTPKIEGLSFEDYLVKYPEVYVSAPPTQYLSVALKYLPIFILTRYMFLEQILANQLWCYKYFKSDFDIKYAKTPENKLNWLNKDDSNYLIEDYPFNIGHDVPYFNRIILIDAPYNQNIDCNFRAHNPNELQNILDEVMG